MVKLCEALELRRGKGGRGEGGTRIIEQNGLLMQLILDCTSCKINQLIPYTNQDLVQIERATINCLKCKTISLMNGSGAGHSKKNMLLADLYMFVKFQKKKKQFYKCTISY
jgi:hypothetical protein